MRCRPYIVGSAAAWLWGGATAIMLAMTPRNASRTRLSGIEASSSNVVVAYCGSRSSAFYCWFVYALARLGLVANALLVYGLRFHGMHSEWVQEARSM